MPADATSALTAENSDEGAVALNNMEQVETSQTIELDVVPADATSTPTAENSDERAVALNNIEQEERAITFNNTDHPNRDDTIPEPAIEGHGKEPTAGFLEWSSSNQTKLMGYKIRNNSTQLTDVHHHKPANQGYWTTHGNVIQVLPSCVLCETMHMDGVVSVLGGSNDTCSTGQICACQTKNVEDASEQNEDSETMYRKNDTPQCPKEAEQFNRKCKLTVAELYNPGIEEVGNSVNIASQAIIRLLEECVSTRRQSQWGRVVWTNSEDKTETAHTSDCYIRSIPLNDKREEELDPRAIAHGIGLLYAVFGCKSLIDAVVAKDNSVCK